MTDPSELEKKLHDDWDSLGDDRPPFKELKPSDKLQMENPKEALEMWEKALEIYPEQRNDTLKWLALAYRRMHMLPQAAQIYEEGIVTASVSTNDYYIVRAAEQYFQMWQFDKAETVLKEAIQNHPSNINHYLNLAWFYRQVSEFDTMYLDDYPEFKPLSGHAPKKRTDDAIRFLKLGLKRIPEHIWEESSNPSDLVYEELINAYVEKGDFFNAVRYGELYVDYWEHKYTEGKSKGSIWEESAAREFKDVLLQLVEVYEKSERFQDAKRLKKRADSIYIPEYEFKDKL